MSATTWHEMMPGHSASSFAARLRISASTVGSGFMPGNAIVNGCLMRRSPPPLSLLCEQSINLCQKLLLFFLVHLASRLARIAGMGRADAAIFAEHEHRRKRVEIHGLGQFLRR